jgi:glycogen debranching enzyme
LQKGVSIVGTAATVKSGLPVGSGPSPAESARLRDEAASLLANNRRVGSSGCDGRPYDYTCPSAQHYPFQWNWDSAFNAIALSRLDPARAKAELSTLLSAVDTDGFLPAVMFRDPADRPRIAELGIPVGSPCGSSTIQPPVVAAALERVFEATGDTGWLADNLDAALRHFRWLGTERSDGRGLVLIERPDESGLDHSPKYDEALGLAGSDAESFLHRWSAAMEHLGRLDFAWSDVLVSAIYGDGLRCLARLCRGVSREQDAAACDAQADQLTAALIRECWDERRGLFLDRWGGSRRQTDVDTITALVPLVLADLPVAIADRLVSHLLDPGVYWLPFGIPSVAATEPQFEPDLRSGALFRGPSWVNLNWYLHRGLVRHGRADAATELAARTARMIAVGGFRECYDPDTGQGLAAADLSFNSIVVDLLAQEGWIGAPIPAPGTAQP